MLKMQKAIDKIATAISAVMLAGMMIILVFNIIMRYIPGIGGVKWYMESSQYLNVWAMLLVGIGITVKNEHLRVGLAEDFAKKIPALRVIQRLFVGLMTIVFYGAAAYSGFLLATKAKQTISTMPQFKMSQVYWMIPIACALCALAALFSMIVDLSGKGEPEPEAEHLELDEVDVHIEGEVDVEGGNEEEETK